MEARFARKEAEESLNLTKVTTKQGKTIMVFTVVTITFVSSLLMSTFGETARLTLEVTHVLYSDIFCDGYQTVPHQ